MNYNKLIKEQQERARDEFLKWDKDATKLKCKPDDLIFFSDQITQQTAEAVRDWVVGVLDGQKWKRENFELSDYKSYPEYCQAMNLNNFVLDEAIVELQANKDI